VDPKEELYALKWDKIDYFNRKVLVRETRLPSGKEGPPKTPNSIRDVDMRPPVLEAFKRQEARTCLQGGYVFLTHANRPFSDAFMRKKFRFLQKLANLKYRSPKQMRHTFATLHIAAGENISWVSRMLGHSSVEITLKKYNRFVPNLTREDGSAFERIMDSDSGIGHNKGTADYK
jgi:integrase